MSATPDSISFEDLADLMVNAQQEVEPVDKEAASYDGHTSDEVSEVVRNGLSAMTDEVNHPIVHKLAACEIIHSLMEWHTTFAERLIEDGETVAAMGWAKDAGKFQAIMNILTTVGVCDDDFTVIPAPCCE
jgi:hypothetical protein